MTATVTLVGRLGADPELRFSGNGTAVVRLSIVTSRRVKDQNSGEWSDADVTWWDCTAFKTLAENAAASLAKGMPVVAAGRVVQENWEDKETGQKRSKLAVKLDSIGPDLTRATATVEKTNSQAQQGGGQQRSQGQQQPNNGWGGNQQQGGWGNQQGQAGPPQNQQGNGWGQPQPAGARPGNSEPPF
jgi:single-strand DNA-binding protein